MNANRVVLIPLTKNPDPKGRIGELRNQDWHIGCQAAVSLEESYLYWREQPVEILILSAFQREGFPPEADTYETTLRAERAKNVRIVRECHETVGQMEWINDAAKKEPEAHFIIIVSWDHYLRVRYLTTEPNIEIRSVSGIPRPKELVTNALLTIAFPIIDKLGKRSWYKSLVEKRRKKGTH